MTLKYKIHQVEGEPFTQATHNTTNTVQDITFLIRLGIETMAFKLERLSPKQRPTKQLLKHLYNNQKYLMKYEMYPDNTRHPLPF